MKEAAETSSTPRDRRNSNRYVKLSLLWAVVYCVCTYLLAREYVEPLALRWLVALTPSLFAFFSTRAYWRYLQGMDELLRSIELRALALSVSVGFVVWPAVGLVEIGIPLDVDVPVILLVMTGVYSYGVIKGRTAHL